MTALRTRAILALLASLTLALTACGGGHDAQIRDAQGPRVRIVGQNFTEADVISHLYAALLDAAGFSTSIKAVGGRDIYLGQLEKGSVEVAGDYLSSTTEALNHQAKGDDAVPVASPDVRLTLRQLTLLGKDHGVTPLEPARAEVKTAYAVTEAFAKQNHLASLSDLGRLHRPVALAGSPDCAERQDCADGLENVYGIRLSKVEPLGSGTPESKAALVKGRVQLAQVATTDTQLESDHLVLLTDDRHLQDAENVTPLVNTAWLAQHDRAAAALNRLADVLTTTDLRALSTQVNVAHAEPAEVAQAYLKRKGLL